MDKLPAGVEEKRSPSPVKSHARASRTRLGWLLLLIALVMGGGGLWWMQSSKARTSAPQAGSSFKGNPAMRMQTVAVDVVMTRDIAETVNAIGTIAASNTAVVRAKVSGEIKSINFSEGTRVEAGQILAHIDPQPFEIALALAQGQLARDEAQLNNAQADLHRYGNLVAEDAAPKQQLDTQAALVDQLRGSIQSDRATVANARLQLSYTKVVAPISGMVGLRQIDVGNVANPSDPNGLLSIAQTQPAAVVFAVPEKYLARIRQSIQAGTPMYVEAWDRDLRTRLGEGNIASTDNSIDPTTGTIRVKALFPNSDNTLFPNQFVNVRLRLAMLKNALSVPVAAIQRGAPGTFVYAVQDSGTVAMRRVQIQSTDDAWSAVQGELRPGDRVVIDGADRLRDGAQVRIASTGPPGAGRGGSRGPRALAPAPDMAASQAVEQGNWQHGKQQMPSRENK